MGSTGGWADLDYGEGALTILHKMDFTGFEKSQVSEQVYRRFPKLRAKPDSELS